LQNIKRFVRYLGSNLARNEKTRKAGYLCRLGSPVMGKPFDLTNLLIFCNKIFLGQRSFYQQQFFQIWAKTIKK